LKKKFLEKGGGNWGPMGQDSWEHGKKWAYSPQVKGTSQKLRFGGVKAKRKQKGEREEEKSRSSS